MEKSALPLAKTRRVIKTRKQVNSVTTNPTRDNLTVGSFASLIESYLITGDIERHSPATIQNRRYRLGRVVWLAQKRGWRRIGYPELQKFFLYLNHGHEEGVGRWDKEGETEQLKPGSVKSFHASIRAFLRWCVKEDELDTNPLDRIDAPIDRPDQIQPFSEAQLKALFAAAKKTWNPYRDEAILSVLIDCALRVSELCALTIKDVDFTSNEITVRDGKGGKTRYIPFGRSCKRALWQYHQAERRFADPSEPMFIGDRGINAGVQHIKRRGIQMLLTRIGTKAKISGVRMSPHTFRHTSAVMMLRAGANVFAVKALLGHEDLAMTNRYVAVIQSDLVAAHRATSPADRIKSGKEGR